MKKKILFLDMDGPIADFDTALGKPVGHEDRGKWETDPKVLEPMYTQGFFKNLQPTKGAKFYVDLLRDLEHFEVYIASNAMTDKVLYSPSEKYEWLAEHFPWLVHRVMLTCDKGLLKGDYLIDDYRENWSKKFEGRYIWFNVKRPEESWLEIIQYLQKENESIRINNEVF